MQGVRKKEQFVLIFNFLECTLLRQAFKEIRQHYAIKPEEMDPKIAGVWYSTRGCKSAEMTAEETRDWLATLHEYKSANLQRLELWTNALARRRGGQYQLELTPEEAQHLLTVLNDHRLLLAARHDIGQEEMDAHDIRAFLDLKTNQQTALYSIHLLGSIIEELLRLIAPDAANWMEEMPPEPDDS